MYNITIVYVSNLGDFESIHIHDANKESIDKALKEKNVYALEYVLENYTTVGVRDFKLYTSQDNLMEFRNKWQLEF